MLSKNQVRFPAIQAFLQTVPLPLPFVSSFSFCLPLPPLSPLSLPPSPLLGFALWAGRALPPVVKVSVARLPRAAFHRWDCTEASKHSREIDKVVSLLQKRKLRPLSDGLFIVVHFGGLQWHSSGRSGAWHRLLKPQVSRSHGAAQVRVV